MAKITEEIIRNILNPTDKCTACEGVFAYSEQQYRDFDNRLYCEVCYKEKYK